jgi:hypothetical protein
MLLVFGAFGIELAEQARRVQLAEAFHFTDGANLVIQISRVVNAREPFGFQLVF